MLDINHSQVVTRKNNSTIQKAVAQVRKGGDDIIAICIINITNVIIVMIIKKILVIFSLLIFLIYNSLRTNQGAQSV